ncbi:MAG: glycosyltransferase family 4 protein [Chloroflexi bacterium]|nr:glycosyltransferase family 4 protein [Chloroflexota bacterium]
MRIGIDGIGKLGADAGGARTFLLNILDELKGLQADHQYYVFASRRAKEVLERAQGNGFHGIGVPGPIEGGIPRTGVRQMFLPSQARRLALDVMYFPNNFLVPFCGRPTVVHVRGLVQYIFSDYPPLLKALGRRMMLRLSVKTATLILTNSNFMKADLCQRFRLPPDKVQVVYHGLNQQLFNTDGTGQTPVDGPYILYVSVLRPYKNHGRLLQAFQQLVSKEGIRHRLVLVGGGGPTYQKTMEKLAHDLGIGSKVLFMGNRDNTQLPPIYRGADLFVCPSLFESFGLPVVEAMACGTPVVASNLFALPEVTGGAALLADPESVSELAKAMGRVIKDRELRAQMIEKGLQRAEVFSWRKTVLGILETIEKAAAAG